LKEKLEILERLCLGCQMQLEYIQEILKKLILNKEIDNTFNQINKIMEAK